MMGDDTHAGEPGSWIENWWTDLDDSGTGSAGIRHGAPKDRDVDDPLKPGLRRHGAGGRNSEGMRTDDTELDGLEADHQDGGSHEWLGRRSTERPEDVRGRLEAYDPEEVYRSVKAARDEIYEDLLCLVRPNLRRLYHLFTVGWLAPVLTLTAGFLLIRSEVNDGLDPGLFLIFLAVAPVTLILYALGYALFTLDRVGIFTTRMEARMHTLVHELADPFLANIGRVNNIQPGAGAAAAFTLMSVRFRAYMYYRKIDYLRQVVPYLVQSGVILRRMLTVLLPLVIAAALTGIYFGIGETQRAPVQWVLTLIDSHRDQATILAGIMAVSFLPWVLAEIMRRTILKRIDQALDFETYGIYDQGREIDSRGIYTFKPWTFDASAVIALQMLDLLERQAPFPGQPLPPAPVALPPSQPTGV